jgi:transposase
VFANPGIVWNSVRVYPEHSGEFNSPGVHSTSNEQFTYYHIHERRGKEAIDEIGILPQYKGVSVHDRWSSYEHYNCAHALCDAHLLRELKFANEEMGKTWVARMIQFLWLALYLTKRNWLNAKTISALSTRYTKIIEEGRVEGNIFSIPYKTVKRRRKAKPKSLRLLEVFIGRREEVLRFIHNKDTPFDNNLAESDLRMIKLKQKISGCFRTRHGAEVFCRIRSYISTVRKQGYSVLEGIEQVLRGKPIALYQPC